VDFPDIEQVTVLHGHVSPDTAYLVPDYPYGRVLRCQIRYWVETAQRGAKQGRQRFVSQTTNPKRPGQPWNKPHPDTYRLRVWLYRNSQGHVHHTGIGEYGLFPAQDARIRLTGIYPQLTDDDRQLYDTVLAASRQYPDPWTQWETAVALIAEHLADTGTPPDLHNGFVVLGEHSGYVGDDDYPLAVAAARRQLSS